MQTDSLHAFIEQRLFEAGQRSSRPLMVHAGAWTDAILLGELGELPHQISGSSYNEFPHNRPAADEIVIESRPYKAGRGGDYTDEIFRIRMTPPGVHGAVLETYLVLRADRPPENALEQAQALEAS